ncbi:hypothetical protein HCB37_04180 [Listeria booriae]|uniref:hypothetical protein n=1 Tax=Listeria booriae TaxID=1552123 RepID=UPI00162AE0C6|nr:hypothetical protein [Listeria booriae]MBC2048222.1 hypothetical protein [Listeria booriae]MBC2263710.1 hypothetical protein [Listeria booriae]
MTIVTVLLAIAVVILAVRIDFIEKKAKVANENMKILDANIRSIRKDNELLSDEYDKFIRQNKNDRLLSDAELKFYGYPDKPEVSN